MVFIYFLGAEPQGLNILNKLYHCAISPVLSLCLKGHKTDYSVVVRQTKES